MLHVGKYQSPDGEVDITPARLTHWAKEHKRLIANRQRVPAAWDHAHQLEDSLPLSLADYNKKRSAKDNVGHLKAIKVAADGKSAELFIDVQDDDAARKAKKNLVSVSPVIMPKWRDGAKNTYEDVITHVDFVNHPVDHSQGPFVEAGALACGLRMGLDKSADGKPRVYRMAEEEPEKKKPSEEEGASEAKGEEGESEGEGEKLIDEVEAPRDLRPVLDALAQFGIMLPEDTDEELFFDRLLTAVHALNNSQEEPGMEPQPEAKEAAPMIATMSLQARAALGYAEGLHRKEVDARLMSLLKDGRCSPAEHEERAKQVQGVRLSLDAKGNPAQSQLEQWIESREALPKGACWDGAKRLAQAKVVNPDKELSAELTEEDAERIVDELYGRKTANV